MDTTCWTIIQSAAAGSDAAREQFARRYEGVVRAYLLARWSQGPLRQEIDDAIQEVFIEHFRDGGVLEKVNPDAPGGFRAFFYGVVRNVARRYEVKTARQSARAPHGDTAIALSADDEQQLTRIFDREWAAAIMREAAMRHREHAAGDAEAVRRVELLELRFREGLPIRDIAERWDEDPVKVHRAYARARKEFRDALGEVVAFHHPSTPEAVDAECRRLLEMLA